MEIEMRYQEKIKENLMRDKDNGRSHVFYDQLHQDIAWYLYTVNSILRNPSMLFVTATSTNTTNFNYYHHQYHVTCFYVTCETGVHQQFIVQVAGTQRCGFLHFICSLQNICVHKGFILQMPVSIMFKCSMNSHSQR